MKGLVLRMAAILVGLLLFWGASEIVCRMVYSRLIDYDVEMWRYARQLKVTGLTPGLRFEHRPNADAHLMGVDVAINAHGMRDDQLPLEKPDKTVRIAIVGDSVTFGWGVPQHMTYPQQLERLLNQRKPLGQKIRFEVLNFGVGNYTAADAAAMLASKALAFTPDLVIYGAFINDAEPPVSVTGGSWLLRHSLAGVLVWSRLDRLGRQLGWEETFQEYYSGLYAADREGQQRVLSALEAMAELCRRRSIPLYVGYLPELHDPAGDRFAAIRTFYRTAAASVGADFIDLRQGLQDNSGQEYWVSEDDAHPNAAACGIYARNLFEQIPWVELFP